VLHCLIGPPVHEGFSLEEIGPLWKFCAYMRGPHALEVLLHVFPGSQPRPLAFEGTAEEKQRLINACRLMVLTRCRKRAAQTLSDHFRFLLLSASLKEGIESYDQLIESAVVKTKPINPDIPTDGIWSALQRDQTASGGGAGEQQRFCNVSDTELIGSACDLVGSKADADRGRGLRETRALTVNRERA
jgi:hypothetical protein